MRPWQAWLLVTVSLAATAAALLAPWPVAALLLAAAMAAVRRPLGLLLFLATALVFQAAFLGFNPPSGTLWFAWGPFTASGGGLQAAATSSIRLTALVGVPSALTQRVSPAALVEGLRLPPRWTAVVAAIWLAAQDVQEDWRRLGRARRSLGQEEGRLHRAAAILPPLLQRGLQRAHTRQEALTLAGIPTGRRFAPIVAFTALAAAGRLATVAVPNIAPTYLVVFIAGWWGGVRVGAATGALSMLVTDLLISGLAPAGLVNVPAMAVLGVLGALLGRLGWERSGEGLVGRSVVLGVTGLFATLLFGVLADSTAWLLPEYRTGGGALLARIVVGMVFLLPAAATNAVLFALAVPPAARAARAVPL